MPIRPEVRKAQNLLLLAVGIFTLFTPAAWWAALFHKDYKAATLSEMVWDSNTPAGKLFFFSMFATGSLLISGGYNYTLPNASGSQCCEFVRDGAAVCLILVGVVPACFTWSTLSGTIDEHYVPYIHVAGAILSFTLFVSAELPVLHRTNGQLSRPDAQTTTERRRSPALGKHERHARCRSCGVLMAAIVAFAVNHLIMDIHGVPVVQCTKRFPVQGDIVHHNRPDDGERPDDDEDDAWKLQKDEYASVVEVDKDKDKDGRFKLRNPDGHVSDWKSRKNWQYKDALHDILVAWTFRFELVIGCAFVWQCALIWAFSFRYFDDNEEANDPVLQSDDIPLRLVECLFQIPWQFFFLVMVVIYDICHGHGDFLYGFLPILLEVLSFGFLSYLSYKWVMSRVCCPKCPCPEQCPILDECCLGRTGRTAHGSTGSSASPVGASNGNISAP